MTTKVITFFPRRSDIEAWSSILQMLHILADGNFSNVDLEVGYNQRMVAVVRTQQWTPYHEYAFKSLVEQSIIDDQFYIEDGQ